MRRYVISQVKKIIVHFCIPNLIAVTEQRGGKFATRICVSRKKRKRGNKKGEEARISRLAIKRANERDVTRPRGILANSRDTKNCRGWKICSVRVSHFDTSISEEARSIFARVLAIFSKRTRDINLANNLKDRASLYFTKNPNGSYDWSIFDALTSISSQTKNLLFANYRFHS